MAKTSDRMGVNGKDYGLGERALAMLGVLTRDEKLALAWACVDQASSLMTTRIAQRAMDGIEDLYDAEEAVCEACETTMCACDGCGAPCTRECDAACVSRTVAP